MAAKKRAAVTRKKKKKTTARPVAKPRKKAAAPRKKAKKAAVRVTRKKVVKKARKQAPAKVIKKQKVAPPKRAARKPAPAKAAQRRPVSTLPTRVSQKPARAPEAPVTPPAPAPAADLVNVHLAGPLLPFDYQPSGEEISGVRAAVKRLSEDIINGQSIDHADVEHVLDAIAAAGVVTPMELWLLWRGFVANLDQFTLEAARRLRRFLSRHGVTNPS